MLIYGVIYVIVTFCCLLVTQLTTNYIFNDPQYYEKHLWPKIFGFVVAAIIVWLCRRQIFASRAAVWSDTTTSASHPGRITLNQFRWATFYPKWPLILGLAFGSCMFAGFFFSPMFFVALVPLRANWLYWTRLTEQFWFGCANPAVVVSTYPLLIAVSTDLSKGPGNYPVIKILPVPLRAIKGQPPIIDQTLVTVSFYERTATDAGPHWADFSPLPVEFATGNKNETRRLEIDLGNEWDLLYERLALIPKPYAPGLYPAGGDWESTS